MRRDGFLEKSTVKNPSKTKTINFFSIFWESVICSVYGLSFENFRELFNCLNFNWSGHYRTDWPAESVCPTDQPVWWRKSFRPVEVEPSKSLEYPAKPSAAGLHCSIGDRIGAPRAGMLMEKRHDSKQPVIGSTLGQLEPPESLKNLSKENKCEKLL